MGDTACLIVCAALMQVEDTLFLAELLQLALRLVQLSDKGAL